MQGAAPDIEVENTDYGYRYFGIRPMGEDQTYGAIEAFSGALALKRDSMLAYLKRGDTYRRRGELTAASGEELRAVPVLSIRMRP